MQKKTKKKQKNKKQMYINEIFQKWLEFLTLTIFILSIWKINLFNFCFFYHKLQTVLHYTISRIG